ncbi:MAG: hypothetical protein J5494_06160, partial [Candidatus Methanomethylophilaceae archaeon]|nr:hypothetical protein [Candidatus Methanomethylophilaceae archaeon]
MKAFLSIFLSFLLLLPLLLSCGETPQTALSSSENRTESASASEPATEEPSEPEADPFEGADPLPDGLTVPSSLKTSDGSILGTIVLTKAGEEDVNLSFAAQDLQYLLQKVLGDTFPIVSRTGEGYGSLILATPDSLPAVSEMFAHDIAW